MARIAKILLILWVLIGPALAQERDFQEVWELTRDHFMDPELRGLDWDRVRREYAPRAAAARTPDERAAVINEMLGLLKTSHTQYYPQESPEYYQLAAVFDRYDFGRKLRAFHPDGPVYVGSGLVTRVLDGKRFVSGVIEGTPAQEAGFLLGDEILSVEGQPFHPWSSFAEREGESIRVEIRRTADGPGKTLSLRPRRLDGNTMFVEAMKKSARTEVVDGVKVAYVHVWSYAGEQYQQILQDLVDDRFRDARALVLDVRGGWGGAWPSFLNLYNREVPVLEFTGRNGRKESTDSQWRKPLIYLVDGTSRSGKEILARGIQRYKLGTVVGERTAGAVVFGRAYLLESGNLLYLAVGDAHVDGERLEGVGVEPDVRLPLELPYAQGRDSQLRGALEAAARAGGSN